MKQSTCKRPIRFRLSAPKLQPSADASSFQALIADWCRGEDKKEIMDAATKKRKVERQTYIPAEIINAIFLHLPFKSLARFKTTCKQWGSHVQDNRFIDEHRQQNMKPRHLLVWDTASCLGYCKPTLKLHLLDISHKEKHTCTKTIDLEGYAYMLPSSYGLVCLHSNQRNLAILNPTGNTKHIKLLPDIPEFFLTRLRWVYRGDENSFNLFNYLGFGFDIVSKKYKVCQLVQDMYDHYKISKCYVLTVSDEPSWREVDVPAAIARTLIVLTASPSIYVNGVVYWEILNWNFEKHIEIFCFDLSKEDMRIIVSPGKWRNDEFESGRHVVELQGSLCLAEMIRPDSEIIMYMDIWKLSYSDNNRDGYSWIHLYKLDLGPPTSVFFPLCVDKHERVLLRNADGVHAYDLNKKALTVYKKGDNVDVNLQYKFDGTYRWDKTRATVHWDTIVSLE